MYNLAHFDQISVKISISGVLYPYRCTDGVKFGTEEGTVPNFTPSVQRLDDHMADMDNS